MTKHKKMFMMRNICQKYHIFVVSFGSQGDYKQRPPCLIPVFNFRSISGPDLVYCNLCNLFTN